MQDWSNSIANVAQKPTATVQGEIRKTVQFKISQEMARMSNTCFDVSIKQSLHFVIFLVRQNYKSIRKQINIWKLWPMKSRQEIFLYYKFMSCHAVYTLYRILLQNYSHLHTKPVTLYSIETDRGWRSRVESTYGFSSDRKLSCHIYF